MPSHIFTTHLDCYFASHSPVSVGPGLKVMQMRSVVVKSVCLGYKIVHTRSAAANCCPGFRVMHIRVCVPWFQSSAYLPGHRKIFVPDLKVMHIRLAVHSLCYLV